MMSSRPNSIGLDSLKSPSPSGAVPVSGLLGAVMLLGMVGLSFAHPTHQALQPSVALTAAAAPMATPVSPDGTTPNSAPPGMVSGINAIEAAKSASPEQRDAAWQLAGQAVAADRQNYGH